MVCTSLASQESVQQQIKDLEHDYLSYILPDQSYWDSTYISKSKGFGLNLGVGYNTATYLDFGFAYGAKDKFGIGTLQSTLYAGSEFIFKDDKLIYGPKIASWTIGVLGVLSTGYNLIYYTDFQDGSWQFRPELGLGYKTVKLNYGYNIPINNRTFGNLSRHTFSLVWYLNLKTVKSESYTYREIYEGELELIRENSAQ